eukprot:CAMPEP_0115512594 /NCGR_PEP_ID=MMETSP0271-20121206/74598_1 /TAXON_ID=71861 /ORGANISM="Scrippsiella trochoidea, Strain CCMP3099" /LENGTH=42 /DNA_ID= /DNA_START= /DNA_END= /DNA_ORIENTATION=
MAAAGATATVAAAAVTAGSTMKAQMPTQQRNFGGVLRKLQLW